MGANPATAAATSSFPNLVEGFPEVGLAVGAVPAVEARRCVVTEKSQNKTTKDHKYLDTGILSSQLDFIRTESCGPLLMFGLMGR